MPSECIGTFGLDSVGYEDLNSPSSLYPKDSVNSLLPKVLQIPASDRVNIKYEQLETESCNDRGHDRSSCTSNTTTTFPTFESNQHSLGAFDNLDLTQSKGLGVSNTVVSFPLPDCNEAQGIFHQFSDSTQSSVSSPAPSSPLMSPSSGYLSAMDELDGESLQELMSLTDENSIASLAELMESELPSKRKCRRLSLDQSSPSSPSESEDSPVFESDGAVASPTCFAFSKTILKNSEETSSQECAMETNPPVKPMKEPSLNVPFPSKENGIELKVLVQPESHHRARYQTEGSRGCVKDESQNAFPTVKLLGCNKPVALQVFIGNDSGKVKPHGFYQASRVCGRNNTPCEEKTIDATTVIEMFFDPAEDMVVSVDCVGIMKLRNADVEHKGLTLPRSKKRSTKARMVFRVNIPKDDGTYRTLQVASSQIACTQPTGMPEIMKKSLSSCSVKGGEELFVLGKNFVRGTTVKFQEICDDQIVWEESAKLDKENFQHNHLVCCIPPYKSQDISTSVEVSLVITTGNGRESDSQQFTYTPLSVADADAAQVRTEQYEAQMCTGNERKTSTEVESVKSRTEVPQHDQSLQSGNDSSFAEQLKMVALLATGQTNLNSGNGLAQKVMSVVNKHKQHQQSQHQQAILQQQQSYLGDGNQNKAADETREATSVQQTNLKAKQADQNQIIFPVDVDSDLDAILANLHQVAAALSSGDSQVSNGIVMLNQPNQRTLLW